jgi:hypothetical protein
LAAKEMNKILILAMLFSPFSVHGNDLLSESVKKVEKYSNNYFNRTWLESMDTDQNKNNLLLALKSINKLRNEAEAKIVLKVYLYYDATDNSASSLAYAILLKNGKLIEKHAKHLLDSLVSIGHTKIDADYVDLKGLIDSIKTNYLKNNNTDTLIIKK